MSYSIILPTYNERENLPIIYYLLDQYLTKASLSFEVVVVDDASPDGTQEVARSIQKVYGSDKLVIVSRAGKMGLGSAYKAGLQIAKGDYIVLMDADFSHHPKFIPKMVQIMHEKNADLVSGTRYAAGGGVAGWNWKRKVVSKGANILADTLLNARPMSDLTGSFRLYKRQVLESILPKVECTGYAFQMEIVILAHKAGYKMAQIPITFVDRLYGESKLGKREILLYIRGLVTLFFTT